MKEEVLRLDAEKRKAAKFCPPCWPPVISIMERERRKRARRELEWVRTVEASARDPQSRPHSHSGGRETEGEDSGVSPFRPPHWLPIISAAERLWFLRELERAQAKQRKRKGSKAAPVTRCTVYRRKWAVEQEKRILGEAGTVRRWQVSAGLPCNLCGQPKRLELGHVTYRGTSFCYRTSGWQSRGGRQERIGEEASQKAQPGT
ncbi:hypothetical protein AOLI_G00216340 [Acnodon oligacanthus]